MTINLGLCRGCGHIDSGLGDCKVGSGEVDVIVSAGRQGALVDGIAANVFAGRTGQNTGEYGAAVRVLKTGVGVSKGAVDLTINLGLT